jgi:hypothetical protein
MVNVMVSHFVRSRLEFVTGYLGYLSSHFDIKPSLGVQPLQRGSVQSRNAIATTEHENCAQYQRPSHLGPRGLNEAKSPRYEQYRSLPAEHSLRTLDPRSRAWRPEVMMNALHVHTH